MAARVGFEPTIRGYRIHTFQACAFDHSATAPHACLGEGVPLATKSRHRNSGLCMIDWVGGKNVLLESHWTALRGKGIPCERCLKSPFPPSKTRGKGLLRFSALGHFMRAIAVYADHTQRGLRGSPAGAIKFL